MRCHYCLLWRVFVSHAAENHFQRSSGVVEMIWLFFPLAFAIFDGLSGDIDLSESGRIAGYWFLIKKCPCSVLLHWGRLNIGVLYKEAKKKLKLWNWTFDLRRERFEGYMFVLQLYVCWWLAMVICKLELEINKYAGVSALFKLFSITLNSKYSELSRYTILLGIIGVCSVFDGHR